MKLTKVKDSYGTYRLEIEGTQLEAIYKALEAGHADPVSDELFNALKYYIKRVDAPGEETEEEKDGKESAAEEFEITADDDESAEPGSDSARDASPNSEIDYAEMDLDDILDEPDVA